MCGRYRTIAQSRGYRFSQWSITISVLQVPHNSAIFGPQVCTMEHYSICAEGTAQQRNLWAIGLHIRALQYLCCRYCTLVHIQMSVQQYIGTIPICLAAAQWRIISAQSYGAVQCCRYCTVHTGELSLLELLHFVSFSVPQVLHNGTVFCAVSTYCIPTHKRSCTQVQKIRNRRRNG